MVPEIERNNWSIVLVGSFNPAIFHPSWFLLNKIVSKETAEAAEIHVVHPEVSAVTMGALRIDTQQNRFLVQTGQAPDIAILDFVTRVFGDLLPHSKITQFGINRAIHFRTPTPDDRIRLGRLFAPTDPWGTFGQRIKESRGDLTGGMTSVTMREIVEGKEWIGHIDANLTPSYELDMRTGVQIMLNNHFELRDYKDGEGAQRALAVIQAEFESRMHRCEEIISAVMEHFR